MPTNILCGDGLCRGIHNPACRYVAENCEEDVRLACLLACAIFFPRYAPTFIYSCSCLVPGAGVPLPLLLSFSRAHAIAQWRCAEGFAKHSIQFPLRPAPLFADQTESHPRSTV